MSLVLFVFVGSFDSLDEVTFLSVEFSFALQAFCYSVLFFLDGHTLLSAGS